MRENRRRGTIQHIAQGHGEPPLRRAATGSTFRCCWATGNSPREMGEGGRNGRRDVPKNEQGKGRKQWRVALEHVHENEEESGHDREAKPRGRKDALQSRHDKGSGAVEE